MENGYKIQWSESAVSDYKNIIAYLQDNWSEKEVRDFLSPLGSK